MKNDNIAPKFHVEDNHEPIIDRETFLLVQQFKETRAKQTVGKDKNLSKYSYRHSFSGIIICHECGRTLKRRYWTTARLQRALCSNVAATVEGKHNCRAKALYQESIEAASLQMLIEVFMQKYLALNGQIRTKMNDINATEKQIMVKFQKESKLSQMKKIIAKQMKPFEELDIDQYLLNILHL